MLFKVNDTIIEAANKRMAFMKKVKYEYDRLDTYDPKSMDEEIISVCPGDVKLLSNNKNATEYFYDVFSEVEDFASFDTPDILNNGINMVWSRDELTGAYIFLRLEESEISNGVYEISVGYEDEEGVITHIIEFDEDFDEFIETVAGDVMSFYEKYFD